MTFLHKINVSYTATSWSLDFTDNDDNNVAVKLDGIYAVHSTAHSWFFRNSYTAVGFLWSHNSDRRYRAKLL